MNQKHESRNVSDGKNHQNNLMMYYNIKDGYFVNKAVSQIFLKCIECNAVPYPCFSISNENRFICKICKLLDKYKNIDIRQENGLNVVIGNAVVFCLNNKLNNNNGNNNICVWKGNLSKWNKHNNECLLSRIMCQYCNNNILRKDLNKHYNICGEYPIKCPNNGCNKIIKRKNIGIHTQNECEYMVVLCKKCQNILMRKEYTNHEENCPKRIVTCVYRKYGCNISTTFDQIHIHMTNYSLIHCQYLENALNSSMNDLNELKLSIQQKDNKIRTLKSSMNNNKATVLNGLHSKSLNHNNHVNGQIHDHSDVKCDEEKTELPAKNKFRNKMKKCHSRILELENDENIALKSDTINEFNDLVLNEDSVITTHDYDTDDKEGGILLIKVNHDLILNDNSQINLNGLGYRGGDIKKQGYSYKGNSIESSKRNYGAGGGSGVYYINGKRIESAGGAGYGTKGDARLGEGGKCYGNNKLDILYLGSGGGGGKYCIYCIQYQG